MPLLFDFLHAVAGDQPGWLSPGSPRSWQRVASNSSCGTGLVR
jgi:hypothetical protein